MGEVVEMADWRGRRADAAARNHPPGDVIHAIWAEHFTKAKAKARRRSSEAWEAEAMREMGFVFPDDPTWEDPA